MNIFNNLTDDLKEKVLFFYLNDLRCINTIKINDFFSTQIVTCVHCDKFLYIVSSNRNNLKFGEGYIDFSTSRGYWFCNDCFDLYHNYDTSSSEEDELDLTIDSDSSVELEDWLDTDL